MPPSTGYDPIGTVQQAIVSLLNDDPPDVHGRRRVNPMDIDDARRQYVELFGSTLVAKGLSVFHQVIQKYYEGYSDDATLRLIGAASPPDVE